jgi:hypothetical protein
MCEKNENIFIPLFNKPTNIECIYIYILYALTQ